MRKPRSFSQLVLIFASKLLFIKKDCSKRKKIPKRKRVNKQTFFKGESFVILILLTLFCINAGLVSFVGYVMYQEIETLYRESLTEFPVPCEDLSLSADEDFITFGTRKNDLQTSIASDGKYVCSKKDVTKLVETVVERKSRVQLAEGLHEQYLSCGNESLAEKSGHLTVSLTKISKHQNDSDIKLHWDMHQRHYHVDPSIMYHNGAVTIPEGRTYFVYATAHFNISRQKNHGNRKFERPQRVSIRICKNVYGYERTLLGRTQLFNMTNKQHVLSSLSIGSHLELSRNDTIYVRVSDARKIIRNSKGNNFGLFPLG